MTGHSDVTLSVDSLAGSIAANQYHLRLLPLPVKANIPRTSNSRLIPLDFVEYSSPDRIEHSRPAIPRSPLALTARICASGRTAEPDAPLRVTLVTRTRAERNRAVVPNPPFEPQITSHIGSFTTIYLAHCIATTSGCFSRHRLGKLPCSA
jgi:hypothetical protein